jgi:5-histidylcysteine sulfoxide synthase/putative 4-mercaptohistidine N1-methyltranferase
MPPVSLYSLDMESKRQEIKEYFNNTYDLYESLFDLLADDKAFFYRANPLRHPLIFYFGHTAAFFINRLIMAKVISERIDPKLESIFAVGVDEMSWDDLDDSHYEWPTIPYTKEYRDRVRSLINHLIDSLPLESKIEWDSPFWVILMGCEHERIHLETSSVLIRQLPIEMVRPDSSWSICRDSGKPPKNQLLDVQGGSLVLKKSQEDDFYGWDNEYGRHKTEISNFKASKFLVSNAEFLEFVHDGGYESDEFWTKEGLEWRDSSRAKYPTFWIKDGPSYKLRHLTCIVSLPLNHPVEVNYLEAKAYCNYLSKKSGKSIRLPSEDEWYLMVKNEKIGQETEANINLKHFSSTVPVDRFSHGDFYDLRGNVWQWSETPIYPFDGFRVHPVYDDFTTPTFDNRHNLIKGGSWISTGNETLLSARYAFRRHFFQHAGFRYVQSDIKDIDIKSSYEDDTSVNQYIEFGWGSEYFDIPNFPKECIKEALIYMKNKDRLKALDIGCAIGRSSFELAREFSQVVGLDYSARFIQSATRLKEDKSIKYKISTEGDLVEYKTIRLKDFELEDESSKVSFFQADACNLKPLYSGYDLIFAGNLIDRLYSPKKFLQDISHRLVDGGIFIIVSPYTWLEEFTPKSEWIGGYIKDQKNYTTLNGLQDILQKEFELIATKDIPFVIRETQRKFQHTLSQMSVWQKR